MIKKYLFIASVMVVSVLSLQAQAMRMQCSELKITPSPAGYYVDATGGPRVMMLSFVHSTYSGQSTALIPPIQVALKYDAFGRVSELNAAEFNMKFSSPYDTPTDTTRGFYTLNAVVSSGERVTLPRSKYFFCHIMQ